VGIVHRERGLWRWTWWTCYVGVSGGGKRL